MSRGERVAQAGAQRQGEVKEEGCWEKSWERQEEGRRRYPGRVCHLYFKRVPLKKLIARSQSKTLQSWVILLPPLQGNVLPAIYRANDKYFEAVNTWKGLLTGLNSCFWWRFWSRREECRMSLALNQTVCQYLWAWNYRDVGELLVMSAPLETSHQWRKKYSLHQLMVSRYSGILHNVATFSLLSWQTEIFSIILGIPTRSFFTIWTTWKYRKWTMVI